MSEQPEAEPEQETRGGEHIEWSKARPGKPLPEKAPPPLEAEEISELDT